MAWFIVWVIGTFSLLSATVSIGQTQLAFPTAEGYGRFSSGGRGGKAYNINTLSGGMGTGGSCNAGGCVAGPGQSVTFLDCWTDRFGVGARTCIFKVGGLIDIPFQYYSLKPNITIAGQTAPGDGITIKNFLLTMCAFGTCTPTPMTNAIMRHFRIRPGSAEGTQGATGEYNAHDIIWDHMSFSWAIADTTGAVVGSYNVTYQWSLWTEGLNFTPGVGEPSKAFLNQTCTNTDGVRGFSLLHNFIANMWDRFPYLQCGDVQFVNNVIYNGKTWSLIDPPTHGGRIHTNFVNNYYKVGPNTDESPATGDHMSILVGCCPGTGPQCNAATSCPFVQDSGLYVSGNYHSVYRPLGTEPETALVLVPAGTSVPLQGTPYPFPTVTTLTAVQARTDVVAKAGAYAVAGGTATVRRDSVDLRAVNDINTGAGRMIASEADVGGYPAVAGGTPYTDTDGDGIADAWESSHGLNPNDPSDGPATAANGYTNLENFLNELAGDTTVPPPALLPAQLLVHWRFDDGTLSSAADATGHGNTGTLIAAPLWQPGRVGPFSLHMDGATQYVTNSALSWPQGQPVSVVVWVNTPGGTAGGAFTVGGSTERFGAHIPYSDNVLYWDYGASTVTGRISTDFSPHVNRWTQVALVSNGSTFKAIYINGTLAASANTASQPAGPLTGLDVGRYVVGTFPIVWQTGGMDDFRLYTYVLSATDIAQLYRSTAGSARHNTFGLR
jgi:hypothetical protein